MAESKDWGTKIKNLLLETIGGFLMHIPETYTSDLISDHLKNRSKIIVCFAVNNPVISKSGCNALPATFDLKYGVENSNGPDFCLIPVSNAGEGNY